MNKFKTLISRNQKAFVNKRISDLIRTKITLFFLHNKMYLMILAIGRQIERESNPSNLIHLENK